MKHLKIVFTFAISFVLVMFVASCTSQINSNRVDKITMSYVTAPMNVPSIVDKQNENFKEAFSEIGIDLSYADFNNGADQAAAVASGDVQILNATGETSFLSAVANGSDMCILSMYSRAPKAFGIFAKDKNIKSPQDLKGKKIAGPKGSNLHQLLIAYLKTANLNINDVEFVNLDISAAASALQNGSIDAALLGGQVAYKIEKKGIHKVTDGEGLISANIVTAVSKKFVKENPDIIEKFLKTQKEIINYINNNREECLQITASALSMDKNDVENMYKLYDFDCTLADKDIQSLQDTEQFLLENNIIENHINIKDYIYETK